MDGRTHLVAGVATGAAIVYVERKLGIEFNVGDVLLIGGCALGSLLPDIDIDNSLLGRFIPGWLFWEHRTVTHSLFFMLVVGILGVILHGNIGLIIGLCLGIGSHLILDGMTPMGLPYLLFPLLKKDSRKYNN